MTFDPTKALPYETKAARRKAEADARVAVEATGEPSTLAEKRTAYDAALKRRISTGSIGSEGVTWKPTIVPRDREFELQGRRLLVEALRSAPYEELEMLERFIGNAQAMADLLQHGRLPTGLKDHWRHPIRGGGSSLKASNVCVMTVEACNELRERRIYPALSSAYHDQWQAVEYHANEHGYGTIQRINKLEVFAASFLNNPTVRRIPSTLIRPIEIGYPRETVVLSEVDFDLRDQLAELQQEAKTAVNRTVNRDSRANHRPTAPHARQARRRAVGPCR